MDARAKVAAGLVAHLNPPDNSGKLWNLKTARRFVEHWTDEDIADAIEHLRESTMPEVGLACIAYGVRQREIGQAAAIQEAARHHEVIKAKPARGHRGRGDAPPAGPRLYHFAGSSGPWQDNTYTGLPPVIQ